MNNQPWFHNIDPVAISIGPLDIHWYGLTYLAAFGAFWLLGRYRARHGSAPLSEAQVGDLLFWGVLGIILGGRLGYVFFYGLDQWAEDWLFPVKVWDGGMSFHGGLIGATAAVWLYGRYVGCGLLRLGDFCAPMGALGLACGRLGNFIGGELWGRYSDVPWAMIFPESIQPGGRVSEALYQQYLAGELNDLARHPSQLYQMALEGLLLFVILWLFSSRPRPTGAVSGLFLAGYAVFRSIAELFREPDAHLGFIAFDWLTMGQLLSFPMFIVGVALMVYAYRRDREPGTGGQ